MSTLLSYKEIQQRILFYYPAYCRLKLKKSQKVGFSWAEGELEVGYALNEMDGSLSAPVEDLMLFTAGLMLSAGREPEAAHIAFLRDINSLIDTYGLAALLAQLSESDAKEVKSDLELLGVVS